MSKLLVTGGAGFIGANFVRAWRKRNPDDELTVLDALTYAGNRANLEGISHIDFVHGDIRNFDFVANLLSSKSIDTIVNFAAETHVDRSILGPDAFIETNIVGTHALLKAAKSVWLDKGSGAEHRFHHVSTDEVFGTLGPADSPFSETTPYAPNSPYAASKAASDHLVRAYHHTFGLSCSTSNCSNNYGPYQFPEKLIPLFLLNALNGKSLPIYGDGRQVRDWLHVDDHCAGIELVIKQGLPGETYNIGGSSELPNLSVIDSICSAIDGAFARMPELSDRFPSAPAARGLATESLKTYVADRPGHDRRYAIDGSRIRKELGFVPRHSFISGLDATVTWYIENQAWWCAVLDGSYQTWVEANYAARG